MMVLIALIGGIALGVVGHMGWRDANNALLKDQFMEASKEYAEEIARLKAQVALHINKDVK